MGCTTSKSIFLSFLWYMWEIKQLLCQLLLLVLLIALLDTYYYLITITMSFISHWLIIKAAHQYCSSILAWRKAYFFSLPHFQELETLRGHNELFTPLWELFCRSWAIVSSLISPTVERGLDISGSLSSGQMMLHENDTLVERELIKNWLLSFSQSNA